MIVILEKKRRKIKALGLYCFSLLVLNNIQFIKYAGYLTTTARGINTGKVLFCWYASTKFL